MTTLSPREIERYARQIVMPEIGGAGQQRLKRARVLVIGVGGLGSPAVLYLAGAGVGTLTLCDPDRLSRSNLHRQILFNETDIGRLKVEAARETLLRFNPDIQIETRSTGFDPSVDQSLVKTHDLVLEGTDDGALRFGLANLCENLCVPLLIAGVSRFDGFLTVLKPFEKSADGKRGARFTDFFSPDMAGEISDEAPCERDGVLNTTTGLIGTLMANEAIKEIVGTGSDITGKLQLVDCLTPRFALIRAPST